MNQTNDVLITQTGSLLEITLNRPDQANAINQTIVEAMIDAFEGADNVRACTIRGAGKNFCAGFDLSDIDSVSDGDLLWRFLRIEIMLQAVHHAGFPVMALAQGHVVGAGADLFAACWQRVAAPDCRFQMPGWNFELALGTRRLTALIGSDAARDMLIDTRSINTEQAEQSRLVSCIAPTTEWDETVAAFVQRSQSLSPKAVQSLLALTSSDSRSEDLSAIVRTAGHPGLKDRINQYRNRMARDRAARKAGNE